MNNQSELFVIGAGHMRTGTTSLKLALEKLYGKKCYHMNEMIKTHREHVKMWIDIFNKQAIDKEMADKIFQGYCATTDYPGALFYKDLMDIYPNAKVILTTRNSDDWVRSCKDTTMQFKGPPNTLMISFFRLLGMKQAMTFRHKMFQRVFNISIDEEVPTDEHMKRSFETFNEEVRQIVPKDRLLEFNVKDGWEPLCRFLNIPKPDESFPFVNTTKEFHYKWRQMILTSLIKVGSVVAVLVGVGIFAYSSLLK